MIYDVIRGFMSSTFKAVHSIVLTRRLCDLFYQTAVWENMIV